MLSIILVNYKSSSELDNCINSIVKFEPNFMQYEIIVVDNKSNDQGLVELKKKYPFLNIINAEKNGGFAYGNNIGIKTSKGDFILFLNPDTYIEDNAIEKLYSRLKNDSDLHFIGPQLLYADHSNESYYRPKSYPTFWNIFCSSLFLAYIFKWSKIFNSYYRNYMDHSKENYVEQICGAAFMFRKKVVEILGLLDENYFMYFEESDYCLRAAKNKLKLLYFPNSKIIHTGGFFSKRNWRLNVKHYISSLKYFFRKNYNHIIADFSLLVYCIGLILRILIYGIISDRKSLYYLYCLKYIL